MAPVKASAGRSGEPPSIMISGNDEDDVLRGITTEVLGHHNQGITSGFDWSIIAKIERRARRDNIVME